MIAKISTELAAPADAVWMALKRKVTFLHMTRGFMGFPHAQEWPNEWREGNEVRTKLLFLHLIPGWDHSWWVVSVDEDKRELATRLLPISPNALEGISAAPGVLRSAYECDSWSAPKLGS